MAAIDEKDQPVPAAKAARRIVESRWRVREAPKVDELARSAPEHREAVRRHVDVRLARIDVYLRGFPLPLVVLGLLLNFTVLDGPDGNQAIQLGALSLLCLVVLAGVLNWADDTSRLHEWKRALDAVEVVDGPGATEAVPSPGAKVLRRGSVRL